MPNKLWEAAIGGLSWIKPKDKFIEIYLQIFWVDSMRRSQKPLLARAIRTTRSSRHDLNLRPPGPEGAQDEAHGVSAAGIGSQPVETIQEQQAPSLDPVAENASLETPFGAPVVRELSPDPGPHERLMTVRGVADRLGVCPALIVRSPRSPRLPKGGVMQPGPCGWRK